MSIFRWFESVEEVTSSQRRGIDERARQTITGQVCPSFPPRAGQRKWGILWCHKKVPEVECLRTGCLWSYSHKRLLRLPLPPPDDNAVEWAPLGLSSRAYWAENTNSGIISISWSLPANWKKILIFKFLYHVFKSFESWHSKHKLYKVI